MRDNALNVRLCSAAQFVRQDAVFADIGTDHAYLPIFLLKEGRIKYAHCADINRGPLERARKNASDSELLDRISFHLTDGAAALSGLGITDYAICGMGGELIADIISAAPHLRDKSVNLILQPMTKQESLRRFLAKEGFVIRQESYSLDGKRSYVCFLVNYTGEPYPLEDFEAEICYKSTEIVNKDLQIVYLKNKLKSYKEMIRGKKCGGEACDAEEKIACAIEKYLDLQ